MRKIILATWIFCSSMSAMGFTDFKEPPESIIKWCQDVSTILESALRVGSQTTSYVEEKKIFMASFQEALRVSNSKWHPFFRYTLKAALKDLDVYQNDLAREVESLRRAARQAIYDLHSIEIWVQTKSDARQYVVKVLSRALHLGRQVPQDIQEFLVLKRAAGRALTYMEASDYRRTSPSACAYRILSEAQKMSQKSDLSVPTKILLFREAIDQAIGYLEDSYYCH